MSSISRPMGPSNTAHWCASSRKMYGRLNTLNGAAKFSSTAADTFVIPRLPIWSSSRAWRSVPSCSLG